MTIPFFYDDTTSARAQSAAATQSRLDLLNPFFHNHIRFPRLQYCPSLFHSDWVMTFLYVGNISTVDRWGERTSKPGIASLRVKGEGPVCLVLCTSKASFQSPSKESICVSCKVGRLTASSCEMAAVVLSFRLLIGFLTAKILPPFPVLVEYCRASNFAGLLLVPPCDSALLPLCSFGNNKAFLKLLEFRASGVFFGMEWVANWKHNSMACRLWDDCSSKISLGCCSWLSAPCCSFLSFSGFVPSFIASPKIENIFVSARRSFGVNSAACKRQYDADAAIKGKGYMLRVCNAGRRARKSLAVKRGSLRATDDSKWWKRTWERTPHWKNGRKGNDGCRKIHSRCGNTRLTLAKLEVIEAIWRGMKSSCFSTIW